MRLGTRYEFTLYLVFFVDCYNQSRLETKRVMIAIPQQPQKMSIEEYLEWEPYQDVRYEYINGEVLAMTGGTIPHNDIALNLYRNLYPHLRSRGCRINVSDVKVQVSSKSPYYFPDSSRRFLNVSNIIL